MNRLEGTASPNALASGAMDLGPHLSDMARFLLGDFGSLIVDTKYLNRDEGAPAPPSLSDGIYVQSVMDKMHQ